ncbi:alpha/beta hydrolase [Arthrospiribacter ruber]|uniref:Alpha/beta hydrolase n=1 Tax=Arthrospiribacter ruber TaxID=2487934 RepID=A0A951MH45_9BACT|nr:alpha/beta hydrolase [Arthrospiribacter ruber]MBW3469750.1 alpha/beta hydrolase [Arthrospiribacter ruber]
MFSTQAQSVFSLYGEQNIPNSIDTPDDELTEVGEDGILRISKVSRPTLTAYFPEKEKATGEAVIIVPGGGYWILAAGHEGADVAVALAEMGITAFVLKYRLPSDDTMINKRIGPLQDAQRSLQLVRENAKEWGVQSEKVALLGFSAGGHLSSTAGTKFETSYIPNPEGLSLRPDFLILVYPVISFDPAIGHSGSSKNLLGENPSKEILDDFSSDKHVSSDTPPAFLVHAANDPVSIDNSRVFENALKTHNVPVGTLYYETGGHGFGLYNPESDNLWLDKAIQWWRENSNR